MRLLLLASEFPPGPGGIGTHAYEVARHLSQSDWLVTVITPQDHATDSEITDFNSRQPFTIARLRSIPFPPLKAIYRWLVISRWLRQWQPDRVMASGDRAVLMAAALSRYLPWVAVGHGIEFGVTSSWQRRLIRWSFKQATAVVCVSEFTWHQMLASGVTPQAGQVIPNGADDSRFKIRPPGEVVAYRTKLGFGGANLLLTVGNVTDRKGQEVVIRALPMILEQAPNTHYLMAGLPTRRVELSKLAERLGVADRVHFLGRVGAADLVTLMNCCDVFVMTSRRTIDGDFEGYGIAVVEAALCGKPAVVSRGSGLEEAIVDGVTGFAVPENDEFATAQGILALLLDPNQRQRLGEAARRRAAGQQTWRQRVSDYETLLVGLPAVAVLEPRGPLARDATSAES